MVFSQDPLINNNFLDTSLYDIDTIYLTPDTIKLIDTITILNKITTSPWSIEAWFTSFKIFGESYTRNNSRTFHTRSYDSFIEHERSVSFGTNVTYENDFLTLSTGFGFLNWRDQFFNNDDNLLLEDITFTKLVYLDTIFIEDGNGNKEDTTFITEIREFTRTDSTYLDIPFVNRNFYFEIPIMIGKSWYYDNWAFGLRAGYIQAFRLSFKERVISINQENALVDINKNKLRAKTFSQVQISTNVHYSLYDNFTIFAEWWMRTSLQSAYKLASTVQYKPTYMGLKFGVRYYLFM